MITARAWTWRLIATAVLTTAIVTARDARGGDDVDTTGGMTATSTASATSSTTEPMITGVTTPDAWRIAMPDYEWSFPKDHWAHEGYQSEWWYVTGHLFTDDETEPHFGYQFTFFQVRLRNESPDRAGSAWDDSRLIMGHAAITDLARGEHVFSDVLRRAGGLVGGFGTFPDPLLAWSLAAAGTDDRWELVYNGEGFTFRMSDAPRGIAFDLTTTPTKPLVFQGPNGYSRKGAGGASQYYSFTRLATTGHVTVDGREHAVRGLSWMDKEFSSSALGSAQVGWDWFALHLTDGRDLMAYVLRDATGAADVTFGTLVDGAGRPTWFTGEEIEVVPSGAWTSPKTGSRYPTRWRIRVPSLALDLSIRSVVSGAENISTRAGLHYWEGPVRAVGPDGAAMGRGYVELTGYGERNRPPL